MKRKSILNRKNGTTLSVITGLVALIVNLLINFVLSPFIVKNLGEEANGFTQLAHNFVTYASLITLAFNSMAGRFISVYYHKGEKEKVLSFYASTIICNIVVSIILIPIVGCIIFNISKVINTGNADLFDLRMLFSCVFINFFVGLALSVFQIGTYVINALYMQNIISMIRNILNGLILLCVFTIFPPKMYFVTLTSCVLSILFLPVFAYLQRKLMPDLKFHLKKFSFKTVKQMVSSGIWNTINQCGNLLMTGMDLLITNLFINPTMMGILSISKTVPTAIISVATTLNGNLAPSLTKSWATETKEVILNQLRSHMKISGMLVSIPIITFSAFGREFYSIWMPSVDANILTILSFLSVLAFVPWAGPQVLYNVFTAANKLKVNTISFCINGVLNIVIVVLLLKFTNLGVFAVAGVSSITTIIRNLVIIAPYTARILELPWYEFYKDVGISLLYAIINYIVAMMVKQLIVINGWIGLIIASGITAIVTLSIELIVILNKNERQQLLLRIKR